MSENVFVYSAKIWYSALGVKTENRSISVKNADKSIK